MKRTGITALLASLSCIPVQAGSPQWQVRPSICISAVLGERCQMQVLINTQGLAGQHCLFLNETRLECWAGDRHKYALNVQLTEPAQLQVKDASGALVLTQSLAVKARQGAPSRRRIRQPWSLF